MGKKNNPSRDNSIGKHQRLIQNGELECSAKGCIKRRYGYSRYCLKHKNHIASTGDINQPYIKQFKTTLKPYVENLMSEIDKEINEGNSTVISCLEAAERLFNNPSTINHITVEDSLRGLVDGSMETLPNHIIKSFEEFNGDAKKLLAVVTSVFIFERENPKLLYKGSPLFFHCGKLVYSYTKYERALSQSGKMYYKRRTLTKNQYLILGAKLYSKFNSLVSYFLKRYEAQSVNICDNPLRVNKTAIEQLIEEKEERITFVLEQKKQNRFITDTMVQDEIRAIKKQFDNMIKEERIKND